jgi:hypothetical protein
MPMMMYAFTPVEFVVTPETALLQEDAEMTVARAPLSP